MATTTATITLSSTDLLSDELALTTSATLTGHNNSTGVLAAIGLSRITISDTSETTIFDASAYTDDKAHKIYIKNTGSSSTDYISVGLGDATGGEALDDGSSKITFGKLYAGDWMLIPFDGATDVGDVLVAPSTAEATTIEWMLFFE